MRWPSQLRRRLCIVMLHSSVLVLVYSSMLVIFLGQCLPRIFLRCLLWKVLTVFSSLLVRVHSSLLSRNTIATCFESSDFDALLICLLSTNLLSVLKAYIARICLRLMLMYHMMFINSRRLCHDDHVCTIE